MKFIRTHKKLLLFLVVPIAIALFFLFPRQKKSIETQPVKSGDLVRSISATGSVDSETTVNLNFLTAGKLIYVGAKKGDSVKKNQTIASLDQSTVQKNLENTLKTYAIQRNTFDQTNNNYNAKTPQDGTTTAIQRILQNNQYNLDQAVISVELQDLARQQSFLVSPIDGILTRADAEVPGVNVAITTTYSIADPNNLVFKVDIDEADIGKIKSNQEAKITLDAYPDQTITVPISTIDFTNHTTSTGGNAYTVEAKLLKNINIDYRIGMNGDAEIITAKKNSVLIIPLASITDDSHVYVKTAKGFEKRKVTTGMKTDTDAEVLSGLTEKDIIAVNPTDIEKKSSN